MHAHGVLRHATSSSVFLSSSSSNARRLVCQPSSAKPTSATAAVRSLRVLSAATFTVSDAELESRGFRVHRSPSGLDIPALNDVFARVGFPRRDPGRIRRALDHAGGAVVWVEDLGSKREEGEGDKDGGMPVAFARATGDGVFNAVVWDVVVDPSLQGMGLGRAVMERLVAELRRRGVSNIALYAEPRVIGFYRPLGFAADPDGIRGMVYSRYKNQQKKK